MGKNTRNSDDSGSDNYLADSSDDSEDGEQIADLPTTQQIQKGTKPRISVSAEAFGTWNKKENFVPPFHEKTQEIVQQLSDLLK